MMIILGIKSHLHVVLIMDHTNDDFFHRCENNPALVKACNIIWMDGWGNQTMKYIPKLMLER